MTTKTSSFAQLLSWLIPDISGGPRIIVIVLCLALPSFAQAPGSLDPTFGNAGLLTDASGLVEAVALQPDGKIVVVGSDTAYSAFAIARYNSSGSPDTDFGGGDGKVTTDIGFSSEGANAVAVQSDGKIVVVGTTWDGSGSQWGHFSLVRYNADGSLDLSFGGGDGIVVTQNLGTGWVTAAAVAIQADGKIVAAGKTDYLLYDFPEMTVIRYNPDGTLDLTFGGDGGKAKIPWGPGPFGGNAPSVEDGTSIAIQPDGKFVVAGYSYGFQLYSAVARLNANGSVDETFGSGRGTVFTDLGSGADIARSIVIQSDGKILTAGSSHNGLADDFALVRYTSNGLIDNAFNVDGKVITRVGSGSAVGRSVAVQSDGKILVAGYSGNGPNDDFALARYNSNGTLDTTFGGGDGISTVDFKIFSNDLAKGMVLDNQGRAIVVGNSDGAFAIARFILNAAAPPAKLNGRVVTSDGRGLRNATVTIRSATDPLTSQQTVTSSSFGYFSFDGLTTGQTYTIAVTSKRYRSTPQTLLIDGNLTLPDFVVQ